MPFPSDKELHTAYALSFISTHHWDDLEPYLGGEGARTVQGDLAGTITLDPTSRTFTIKFQVTDIANASSWTWARPGTVFQALNDVPGTLFRARNAPLPQGENIFWMQQHASSDGDGVGRTVIEFYTNKVITAVFKTNVDNFGTSGSGSWTTGARVE